VNALEIAVEVSLYPLDRDFVPPILEFLERLSRHAGLRVVTNSMSTQIVGEYGVVMSALTSEMRTTFVRDGKAVFVMKVLGALPAVPTDGSTSTA
jgi:uncharacterized protein YqgV (UPF0045/DUF77 family)